MGSPSSFWQSRKWLSDTLGISVRTIADFLMDLPPEATKKSRNRVSIDVRIAIPKWIERQRRQAGERLVERPPTPLEHWEEQERMESVLAKRSVRLERMGRLVDRDEFMDLLRPLASIFRDGAERVRREHGNAIGDLMNEIVDEFDAAADELLQNMDDRKSRIDKPVGNGRAQNVAELQFAAEVATAADAEPVR